MPIVELVSGHRRKHGWSPRSMQKAWENDLPYHPRHGDPTTVRRFPASLLARAAYRTEMATRNESKGETFPHSRAARAFFFFLLFFSRFLHRLQARSFQEDGTQPLFVVFAALLAGSQETHSRVCGSRGSPATEAHSDSHPRVLGFGPGPYDSDAALAATA